VLVRACLRTGVVAAVSIAVITGLTGLGFGWIDQLNASSQVLTWVSVPTAIGMLIELLRGVPNFVTYQDPVIAAVRFGGQVVTAAVLFWLWLRAGRAGWVRMLGLSLLAVVFLGPVVQPWYVLWGLTVLGATRLDRRAWLVFAGTSFWLSMMIAPQGSNLFLDWAPVIAMPLAAAVATIAVLGRSRDEVVEPVAAPGKLVVSAPPGDRELGPVASVR
jgi:hypothetical protein